MKKIFILSVILSFFIGCNKSSPSSFLMDGKTNNLKDGVVIYLKNSESDFIIDSTTIKNNAFTFKTELTKTPLKASIFTEDRQNYRVVWLENNPMTFDASTTDFRNAKVQGSEAENLKIELKSLVKNLKKPEKQNAEHQFIKQHPNSIISVSLLAKYATMWGKKTTTSLFSIIPDDKKQTIYGKKIANYLTIFKNPKVGDVFVDFEMSDVNGIKKKLSELKGKVILLEFWASWCPNCREEHPNLIHTYNQFKNDGFEVFAVSVDKNGESWKKTVKNEGLNWINVSDLKGQSNEASLIYGVSAIPDNFLINRDGVIIGKNLKGEQLTQKIKNIL